MFNFKKVLGVVKRSICAALSAVMVLNMFSACAADEIRTYKVVLVGNDMSGKSALRNRIVDNTFSEKYTATIGVDFETRNLQTEDKNTTIKLQLWDTAGEERFRTILSSYVGKAALVLLTVPYDKQGSDLQTYLGNWVNQLKECQITCNVKIVLTKNEQDLPNYNSLLKEQVETFISEHNGNPKKTFTFEKGVIETSAKNGDGIDKLEDYLVNYLTQREQELLNNGAATLSKTEQTADIVMSDDGADGLPEKGNNKKWIIGGGIGAGALLIPAAAILIHKFCHKTPAPKKLA